VGASAIVRNAPRQLMMPDKLWRVVLPEQSELSVYYLFGLLNTAQLRYEISRRATGTSSSMKNISQAKFLDIDIKLPPKDLQDEFERRIRLLWDEIIDKQEAAAKKIEELFQSSLAQAFNGELTAKWREKHQASAIVTTPAKIKEAIPEFNLDSDAGKEAFNQYVQTTIQDILRLFEFGAVEQPQTALNKSQTDALTNFNEVIQPLAENYSNFVSASLTRIFQSLGENLQHARQIYIHTAQHILEATQEIEDSTRHLATQLAEVAALGPQGPDEAHPRYAILKELSEAQYQIYLASRTYGNYFTPEILHEMLLFPLATVKDGIKVLTATGLLASVRLPIPKGNATSYTPAYRVLHDEDNSKYADLAFLQDTL
jgi:hypothetical protein